MIHNAELTGSSRTIQTMAYDRFFHRYIIRFEYPHTIEGGTADVPVAGGLIYEAENPCDRLIVWSEGALIDSSWWMNWELVRWAPVNTPHLFEVSTARTSPQLRTDRLAHIQSAFGFPLQTLAAVLRISRAQLYKWLDPEKAIELHEDSRCRLLAMENVASKWQGLTRSPLNGVAHEPLPQGGDIVSLLTRSDLRADAIDNALSQLADQIAMAPKTVSQRMHERGFGRRASIRSLPSDE